MSPQRLMCRTVYFFWGGSTFDLTFNLGTYSIKSSQKSTFKVASNFSTLKKKPSLADYVKETSILQVGSTASPTS